MRLLPDVTRRDLLAEVRWGWYASPTPYEDLLYRSITRRHTHCGPFTADVPPPLTGELVRIARQERAELHVIYDTGRHGALAGRARPGGARPQAPPEAPHQPSKAA